MPELSGKDFINKKAFASTLKAKLRQSNFNLGSSPPTFDRKNQLDQG